MTGRGWAAKHFVHPAALTVSSQKASPVRSPSRSSAGVARRRPRDAPWLVIHRDIAAAGWRSRAAMTVVAGSIILLLRTIATVNFRAVKRAPALRTGEIRTQLTPSGLQRESSRLWAERVAIIDCCFRLMPDIIRPGDGYGLTPFLGPLCDAGTGGPCRAGFRRG